MNRNSPNTSGAVTDQPEQALTCAAREVIMRKCPALFLVLCFLGCLLLNTGCSVTRGTRTPDGSLTVSNWRFLWRSEAVLFETNSTNFNARLVIGKSASDAESVGAVTEGAVKGVTHL